MGKHPDVFGNAKATVSSAQFPFAHNAAPHPIFCPKELQIGHKWFDSLKANARLLGVGVRVSKKQKGSHFRCHQAHQKGPKYATVVIRVPNSQREGRKKGRVGR